MARGRGGRRGPMIPPMVETPVPAVPPMMPPATGPVEQAVQGMPYSYKGVTAQDIMNYSGEVGQLTPEQMAVADVNQDGAIDLLDATWILQMAEGLRDPNTLEGITQPVPQPPGPPPMMPPGEPMMPPGPPPMMPPGPPPMMPDPVQAAVNTMPPGGGEPMFPGQEPKFPGVPPVQVPEPTGPIAMPPAPPTVPPPPVGGGGRGGPRGPRTPTGTPVDLAQAPYGSVGIHPTLGEIFAGPGVSGGKRFYTADGLPVPKDSPGFSVDPRHGNLRPTGDWYQPPVMDPVSPPVDGRPPPVGNGDMPPVIDTWPIRPDEPPVITAPPTVPPPPVGTDPFPEVPPPGWPDKPPPPFDPWPDGCPSPKEHIQLANNDWILAGELKVGDEVVTSEEPQKVTRVQRVEGAPRCEVLFEDSDSIVSSYSHPYFVNSKGFVEVGDLKKGDIIGDLVVKDKKPFSDGPVISLSVDKAETYMLRGGTEENPVPVLSHNKTPMPPTPEEIEEQMRLQREREERWRTNPPQPGDPEFERYSNWWERENPQTPIPGTYPPPPPGWPPNQPWPPIPIGTEIDPDGPRPPYWPEALPWPPPPPDSCPSPKERIQLSNNDWILAGNLKIGDEVVTSEEPQKVTRVQRIENSPRCEVLFEDSNSIVTSYSHPYFVNSKGFVEVGDLKKGDIIGDLVVKDKKPFSDGPVISLSVDKAHTYMLQGGTEENPVPALSHNKWIEEPRPPGPWDPPTPVTPTTPTGTGNPYGFTPGDPSMVYAQVMVPWYNPETGETYMAPNPGYKPPPGSPWVSKGYDEPFPPPIIDGEQPPTPVTPTPVGTTPTPVGTTPTPTPETTPETTPVQGMTMEEMQKMIADMQAREAERLAKEAEMSKNYMISDERIGYNPYLSGQYQADPYGPGGVPDMGGITTIPVPQSLTGIGYANYNPRRKV